MIFKDAWVLVLLPLVILWAYFLKRKESAASIRFSSGVLLKGFKPNLRIILNRNLVYLKVLAAVLFILALARPQSPLEETKIRTEGIDIVLAVDVSTSMLAEDFTIAGRRKNRLEVVKQVVEDFIKMRKSDRIGMIAFAARAYTVCPLSLDYDWLIQNLARVKIGQIEDGTAVGSGISSSLNRLKNSKAKSKIAILLTDGVNNTGEISPLTAAEAAKALGIKIYTIGAGSKGLVPYPTLNFWGRKTYRKAKIALDEDTLIKIAEQTNGKYFRATDTASLKKIYDEIDALEKTEVVESGYTEYDELFPIFLIPGLILLILEQILANTILRKIP